MVVLTTKREIRILSGFRHLSKAKAPVRNESTLELILLLPSQTFSPQHTASGLHLL